MADPENAHRRLSKPLSTFRIIVTRLRHANALNDNNMQLRDFPFSVINWSLVEQTEHKGETGIAYWRTRLFGDVRVRMVEYTAGYLADHWCDKGHVLLCLSGQMLTELKDGRRIVLKPGMSYQLADGTEPHRTSTDTGATLFIVD